MENLANLPNISSDSNLKEIRKFYDEMLHVRCLDNLNVNSDSYSTAADKHNNRQEYAKGRDQEQLTEIQINQLTQLLKCNGDIL